MHIDEAHFRKLERMYHQKANINVFFQPTLHVSHGAAEIVMPVRREFFHAAHAVHGSTYFKALDDAAFFAANSLVTDVFLLTASYTIYFLRPVTEGTLRGVGRVVHRSRNLFLAEADLFDSQGHLIGRGSGSFMRSNIALNEDVGYV